MITDRTRRITYRHHDTSKQAQASVLVGNICGSGGGGIRQEMSAVMGNLPWRRTAVRLSVMPARRHLWIQFLLCFVFMMNSLTVYVCTAGSKPTVYAGKYQVVERGFLVGCCVMCAGPRCLRTRAQHIVTVWTCSRPFRRLSQPCSILLGIVILL